MDCVGKDKTGKAKDKTTPFCNKYGNMKMCGGNTIFELIIKFPIMKAKLILFQRKLKTI